MVDDLIASALLDAKSYTELLDLLGPDDSMRGTEYGAGYFQDCRLVYWLGAERGFLSIDSEWLVIRLGENGRVTGYRIVTD